jgi:hypothetical protein
MPQSDAPENLNMREKMIKVFRNILNALCLFCILAGLLVVAVGGFYAAAPQPSASVNAKAFEAFSSSLNGIIANHPLSNKALGSLDFSSRDLTYEGDTLMTDADAFSRVTGDTVVYKDGKLVIENAARSLFLTAGDKNASDDNGTPITLPQAVAEKSGAVFFPLEKVARALGYDVVTDGNLVRLTRPYQTARLIVKAAGKIDKCGAVAFAEGYDDLHILQFETEKQALNAYAYYQTLAVAWVEPDLIVTAAASEEVSALASPYRSWGAASMAVGAYSDYLSAAVASPSNLPQVIIAVLDTGIYAGHAMFSDRLVDGRNFTGGITTNVADGNGHGTHVSGIISDLTLSNVKIMPLKVLDDNGNGYASSIINAISYVINQKAQGAAICAINMSLGGEGALYSSTYNSYKAKLEDARTQGIVSVVAAGNDGRDVADYTPSNIESAITVSAVMVSGSSYTRPSFSNYGSFVDVAAPGYQIQSAGKDGGYITMSGTSMATPHVSGAVALLFSDPSKSYTPTQIENLLYSSAMDLGAAGRDDYYGFGLVYLGDIVNQGLDPVTFSRTETTFSAPFELTLSHNNPEAQIRYTLDGSTPTESSPLYSSPISISASTTVKAIAFVYGGQDTLRSGVSAISYQYVVAGIEYETFLQVGAAGASLAVRVRLVPASTVGEVVIPSTYLSRPIVEIGERAFENCIYVTRIILPVGVTTLGAGAFSGCNSLSYVRLPGISNLAGGVFDGATALSELYLPAVQTVGSGALSGASALTKLVLGKNIQQIAAGAIGAGTTIYGYLGTAAQSYAQQNGNHFIPIDDLAISSNIAGSVTLKRGDAATLLVEALGFELSYQWYVNTTNGTFGALPVDGATSSTLDLDTSVVGTCYYYLKITDWDETTYILSGIKAVVVSEAQTTPPDQPPAEGETPPDMIQALLSLLFSEDGLMVLLSIVVVALIITIVILRFKNKWS